MVDTVSTREKNKNRPRGSYRRSSDTPGCGLCFDFQAFKPPLPPPFCSVSHSVVRCTLLHVLYFARRMFGHFPVCQLLEHRADIPRRVVSVHLLWARLRPSALLKPGMDPFISAIAERLRHRKWEEPPTPRSIIEGLTAVLRSITWKECRPTRQPPPSTANKSSV